MLETGSQTIIDKTQSTWTDITAVVKLLQFGLIVSIQFYMGRTAGLTSAQKTIIDALGKPRKFIAKEGLSVH